MLLKQQIIAANFIRGESGKAFLPTLLYVEPKSIKTGSKYKWMNPRSIRAYSLSENDIHSLLSAVLTGEIEIKTANHVAEILEIPVGQLIYILYKKTTENYVEFEVKKKMGGVRKIYSPQGSVKIIQNRVKKILDFFYRPKAAAHGFIKEKSIKTNAKKHIGKKYVLNIDLSNFFESITFARIYGVFKARPFNFGHDAASILAHACTYNGVLPQGAPTSPTLSNIVAASLDKKLVTLARRFKIQYTRYADDITFSFNQKPPEDLVKVLDGEGLCEVGDLLNEVIESCGFKVNSKKTRLQSKTQRQEVTGLVVNNKVNVNRDYIRITRSMIHGWCKDRAFSARKHFNITDECSVEKEKNIIESFRNHIYGRLSFIRMIRGVDFPCYLKLMAYMSHNDPKQTKEGKRAMKETETYDIFICHASEDKDEIAVPVYDELNNLSIVTFIDHLSIKWGDSLVDKINNALAKSKYVIAILSKNSVEKNWPIRELNSVLAREIKGGKVKLLTLIKASDEEYVQDKLPLLADKLYMVYNGNPAEVASRVRDLLGHP
ncbi:TIR domain-containing anti-phage reverse transcriptase [Serratia fonticola]|uniref:TIR domain-containing anti-phage reverse transcriptase n=1 Tax=Serratia fonticola TaxID=47917 RepID=UPI000E0F7732|nr:TIR domain-containing anti-phage reverse transcriptase [Serratia fonticola]RDL17796.1 TIR domain-containing protein [Serratia fonticola]